MVVGRSAQCLFAPRRYSRCTGKSAEGRRTELHDRVAGGAASDFGCTGWGLHPPMIWKLRKGLSRGAIILLTILKLTGPARGQDTESPEKKGEMNTAQQQPSSQSPNLTELHVQLKKHHWLAERVADFGGDQKDLWTSPKNLRFSDTTWLGPITGLAPGLFLTIARSAR